MRIWMCGHTRMDRIKKEVIRVRLGVASISEKSYEGGLKWFGHVQEKARATPVRRVENITINGKRGRGRHKKTCEEQIRKDLGELQLLKDLACDRSS